MINSYVQNRKQPRLEVLYKIAETLGVSARDLLNGSQAEIPNSEKQEGSLRKLTFIDLFAGCGGLSEGFMGTGKYDALAHVEWALPMVNTLRNRLVKNFGDTREDSLKKVIHFDIQHTDELINGKWSKKSVDSFGYTNHPDVISKGLKGL